MIKKLVNKKKTIARAEKNISVNQKIPDMFATLLKEIYLCVFVRTMLKKKYTKQSTLEQSAEMETTSAERFLLLFIISHYQ